MLEGGTFGRHGPVNWLSIMTSLRALKIDLAISTTQFSSKLPMLQDLGEHIIRNIVKIVNPKETDKGGPSRDLMWGSSISAKTNLGPVPAVWPSLFSWSTTNQLSYLVDCFHQPHGSFRPTFMSLACLYIVLPVTKLWFVFEVYLPLSSWWVAPAVMAPMCATRSSWKWVCLPPADFSRGLCALVPNDHTSSTLWFRVAGQVYDIWYLVSFDDLLVSSLKPTWPTHDLLDAFPQREHNYA